MLGVDFLQDQNQYFRFYLGLYIKQKRTELGLTPEAVAVPLGLSVISYKRIEAGRSKIKPEHFDPLCVILELEPLELYEINRISKVAYANALSMALSQNYPT